MTVVTLSQPRDFAALGERWRRLEARADCSFFQTWTWTGCLVQERFPDPLLVEATEAGHTVALALFNRRRGLAGTTLFLGETGVPALDRPYIEHNGVLSVADRAGELAELCLRAARSAAIDGRRTVRPRRLVLSGVGEATLIAASAAAASARISRTQPAPYADLARVRADGGDCLVHRSANTRQQVRRSDRAYEQHGPLSLRRADDVTEGWAFLDELQYLHQATWTARGEPGSFAEAVFRRFHRDVIERGMRRGEIDLLRVSAGSHLIGILYNFRFRGRSLAYQSGFDYAEGDRRQKPGLTAHCQAIRFAAAAGLDVYDFLAGDHRYKHSLADASTALHWVEVGFRFTPRALWRQCRRPSAKPAQGGGQH